MKGIRRQKEGYTHIPEHPWGILGFLVPIIVASGSSRLVASQLAKAKQGEVGPPAPANDAS